MKVHFFYGRLFVCLVLFALLLALVGHADELRPFRIGVLYWSMNIPGQVAMRKGIEARAAAINSAAMASGSRGVELIPRVAGDGEAGIQLQIEQMYELIDIHPDLLLVQPTDNVALSGALQQANLEKIPVVAYDQYISNGKLAAYRTSDNYQAGWLNGEFIAAKFAPSRQIKLILVDYPHVSSTVERLNGFLDALAAASQSYRILHNYQAVEPVSGKEAALQILKRYPEPGSVDVVFTVNDGGGVALASTLFAAGRHEIMHATIDGDPDAVDNIRKAQITVIDSAQFCGPLGEEAMQTAYDILQKKPTPYHALVPVFPVTTETLPQYPGWMGPIPETLHKSWPSLQSDWSGRLKIVKP